MNKLFRILFILLAFQIAVSSCASTKKRDDQSAVGKLWHNMNSHYNGYFNAREIMTETLLGIDEQHVDNYTQRLDMFPFLALDNTSNVVEQLDIAVEKVAIVVKKHPYSNWVDDSYLLIGQAQLIKQDYESAEKTLRFMTTEFRPRPERKKSKKRKGAKTTEEEPEEEAFVSRRKVESNPAQERKDRLRARKEAQKERTKLSKERKKAAKQRKKEAEKRRKERIRARKKGIKLAPVSRKADTSAVTGLENEPEIDPAEENLGPVGMISLFNQASNLSGDGKAYGKKPDSYLVKHRPAFQEGRLWLAWALVKRDNFDQAQLILEDMRANRGTFPDVRRKAMAVQAFLYLEQDKLEAAIPYLEEAAEVADSRNERARFHYIAGQLYQELGQPSGAAGAFEKTIAARPDYELELGARLNLAQNEFLSGTGSAADALKKLRRMVREDKNIPYESQIYFSMAAVALKSNDQKAGAEYLQLALASPSAGPVQQTEAYNLLGDLAYNESDFLSAKLYYDTTLTVMDKGDFRYKTVSNRRDQLTGVADLLIDIEAKDSLLRIGMMPEAAREKWATDLFEQRRKESAARALPPVDGGSRGPSGPAISNSNFWAYSTQAVKRGKRDFERTWGERALTDNWRRSRRTGDTFQDEGDGGESVEAEEVTIITEDEIQKILEGIPATEAELGTMNIQQATNWFNLGREYRDQLDNSEKSINAFETLNERYPNANGEAESWYYLYLIHKEVGNMAKANEYASKLKTRYSGSKYEKLANDASYASKLMAGENKLTREYETAYKAFEDGDFKTAHEMAVKGRATLLGKHPLKAKYALLLAMTTGNTQGRQAYINALRQVVSQFDKTPEQTRAKEILRLLGESGARLPGQTSTSTGSSGFKETMDELHYLIIVFNDEDSDLNAAKIKVAQFNNKYNKADRLRVVNVYLGTGKAKTPVLVIRRIKSGQLAMKYVNNATDREQEFLDAGKFDYNIYAVSQSNYREILKARSVEGYEEWFRENY